MFGVTVHAPTSAAAGGGGRWSAPPDAYEPSRARHTEKAAVYRMAATPRYDEKARRSSERSAQSGYTAANARSTAGVRAASAGGARSAASTGGSSEPRQSR